MASSLLRERLSLLHKERLTEYDSIPFTICIVFIACSQQALFSVTNANEGEVFVDQTAPLTQNTTEYIRQLFPLIEDKDATTGAEIYAMTNLPAVNQTNMIQAEGICIHSREKHSTDTIGFQQSLSVQHTTFSMHSTGSQLSR
jgi:hypothetical protein